MKKLFFFAAAALFAMGINAAELNIYASQLKSGEVTDGKVEISYLLNAPATALELQILNADNSVLSAIPLTDEALLTKGAHTATVDLSQIADGTYTWAIKAVAAPTEAVVEVTDNAAEEYSFYLPQGLEVDKNPESAFFGQIYVTESTNGAADGGTATTKATKQGIFIYDALLTKLNADRLQGYTGNVTFAETRQGPKRLAVAEDGMVFVCDNGAETSGVWMMDPANPDADFKPVLDLSKRGTAFTTVSSLDVVGAGEQRVLYTMDGIGVDQGNAYSYAVGTAETPFAGEPVSVFDVKVISMASTDNSIRFDGRDGFWIAQHRWGDDAYKALSHINAKGERDFASDKTLLPFANNISYRGSMNLNADKTLLAFGSDKKGIVFSIAYDGETGAPALTKLYETAALGTNIDGLAFDYAGNLYVASASSERMYAFATPKADNSCVTPAAKKYMLVVSNTNTGLYNLDQCIAVSRNAGNIVVNASVEVMACSIYNLAGQLMQTVQPAANGFTVNVANLNAGVYMMQINTVAGNKTYKFIK